MTIQDNMMTFETEQLPIAILVDDVLKNRITMISSVCNKLEAMLNFHTMTANWYGDESNILIINFYLFEEESYQEKLIEPLKNNDVVTEKISDDVTLFHSHQQQLDVYVAITNTEQVMIESTPKVLHNYLQKKLRKVMNLIAVQKNFEQI